MADAVAWSSQFESENETRRFASRLAPLLCAGDALLLEGGLGAGKTTFARALIQARLKAAGRPEEVPSPTYTLVQVYNDGAEEIWHADLYRLSDPDEVRELGLEEAFGQAICLIEWPDRLGGDAPKDALRMNLSMLKKPGQRRLALSSTDKRWRDIVGQALERPHG